MAGIDILNLEETTITTDLAGKIIGITGGNNVGKSFVAARLFPNKTLWLATEKGYNAISGMKKVDIESWDDFRAVVGQLTTRAESKRKKVRETYDCVVVDVADKLPNLCNAYIIKRYNEAHENDDNINEIAEIPYGGGYSSLNKEMDNQITRLSLSGFCVVLIFHEEIKVKKDERGKEYDYFIPKGTFNKAGNALKDIPDFMFYVKSNGVDKDGKVVLSTGYCNQHKEFFARSRMTYCPDTIDPFTAENLKETVRIACEKEAEMQGATPITYEEEAEKREAEHRSKKLSLDDLKGMIEPVFKALVKAKYKSFVVSTVSQYLGVDEDGNPLKVKEVDDEGKVGALQMIYDALVDYANDKDVDWE